MRPQRAVKALIIAIVSSLVLVLSTVATADDQADLAKESQNPIGNIISLPFENNFDFGVGPEDALVYALNIKPVYPYNFKSGWYFLSTSTITANWEADSDDCWTVPVGGGVGKLIRCGRLPVDVKAQGFVNAVKPDGAADWTLRVQVKLLFPK